MSVLSSVEIHVVALVRRPVDVEGVAILRREEEGMDDDSRRADGAGLEADMVVGEEDTIGTVVDTEVATRIVRGVGVLIDATAVAEVVGGTEDDGVRVIVRILRGVCRPLDEGGVGREVEVRRLGGGGVGALVRVAVLVAVLWIGGGKGRGMISSRNGFATYSNSIRISGYPTANLNMVPLPPCCVYLWKPTTTLSSNSC